MGRSGNTDSLSKVPDSVIHETTTSKHGLSGFFVFVFVCFFPRVAEAFVPELTEATFGLVAKRETGDRGR